MKRKCGERRAIKGDAFQRGKSFKPKRGEKAREEGDYDFERHERQKRGKNTKEKPNKGRRIGKGGNPRTGRKIQHVLYFRKDRRRILAVSN